MKKLISIYTFLTMISISAMEREITTTTKRTSDRPLSVDMPNLALAYTLLHEQKFFPIQVGTKSIIYKEFGQLEPAAKKSREPNKSSRLLCTIMWL